MPLISPIQVWTPAVSLLSGNKQKTSGSKTNTQSASASKPSGSGSKPSGSSASTGAKPQTAQQTAPEIPSFESIFQQMLKEYLPETVEFTPLSNREISNMIASWLRPAYEQAIRDRQTQTRRSNAELDADAWSRGMGTSTYVTDVKNRAYEAEAQDVSDLESDYAATLAGHLYDAVKAQQEQKLEVDRFNAEQINHAREQALSAAKTLYNTYLSAANQSTGSRRSGSGGRNAATESSSTMDALLGVPYGEDVAEVDYSAVADLLSRMTPQERAALYAGSDPDSARQKLEIIRSLGSDVYNRLKAQFPA